MSALFKRFLRDVLYYSALIAAIGVVLSIVLCIVLFIYLFVVDQVRVAEFQRTQYTQEEIMRSTRDLTADDPNAQDVKDVAEGRDVPP